MSAEVIDQGIFWLFCFVTGAVITFIYDQIRIVRRVLPHGSVLVAIEDLLFWLFAGIVIFFVAVSYECRNAALVCRVRSCYRYVFL